MANRETSEHANPINFSAAADVPETSYAERARTLVYLGRVGALATLSRKQPGWPFGSVMPYGLDSEGRPSFLISTMAMHTQNILSDDRASLLVTAPNANEDPLGAGRVTLMGRVAKVRGPEDLTAVRKEYLQRYDNASYWVDFNDFAFFYLDVIGLYFVGGFGVMGWVSAEEYLAAAPDPLAGHTRGILEHMNTDHVKAQLLLARRIAGIEAENSKMTAVDRLGFHLRLETAEGMRGVRIPFVREVMSAEDTRSVLVEMVQRERNGES